MENRVQIISLFFISIFLLTSCRKEIKLDAAKSVQQLVAEGYIEPNKYPIVYLTKTSDYFQQIDSSTILNYIASYAKVSVSVDGNTEVLTLKRFKDKFPIFYYQGNEIYGEVGKTYNLKIELSGKEYQSNTTISEPVDLNDLEVIDATNASNYKILKISFNDPINVKNYYRIYFKRVGKDTDFLPCYLSTFTDYGFDGKTFNYELIRSHSPLNSSEKTQYFSRGDSVIVKFCTIEKKQYDYWKAIETQIAISSNPFGLSSSTPISLITNNALGVWGGLSSKYFHIKIK